MTVESTVTKAGPYTGNGVTTTFSFSFTIYASTDLEVTYTDASGVETVLSEGAGTSNYSVTVAAYPGSGSITYPASGVGKLSSSEKITIRRVLPLLQSMNLENQGGYFPETQETAFDKLTMMVQRLKEESDRSVKVGVSSGSNPSSWLTDINNAVTAASGSATAAATSATASATSATAAAASATAAASSAAGAGVITNNTFSGTGSQTVFTLTVAPPAANAIQVYVSGIRQARSTYSFVGTTLTFTSAPPAGTNNIEVVIGTTGVGATGPQGPAGPTGPTGGITGGSMTGSIDELKSASSPVASAATTNIWVTDGNFLHVSGTTTITSLGTAAQAGATRTVVFDGALTLTHNATSLILPGGANITTAAGDTMIVRAETTSNHRVIAYVRADGTALVAPGNAPITGNNVVCPHENLVVKYATASTLTITADTLLLRDVSRNLKQVTSVNLTANITTSGANGLDTGAEASSTWYHIWVVSNGSTTAALLSTSATAPTMPGGYTYKGYVGAVYNDGSSNFVLFNQRGTRVDAKLTRVLNTGTATTYTAISLSSTVPTTAVSVTVSVGAKTSTGSTAVTTAIAAEGTGTTSTYGEVYCAAESINQVYNNAEVVLTVAQQVKYFVVGTNANGDLWVNGWRF